MATTMLWVMLFITLLVNMVMAAQFESFFQPLALLMTGQSHSVMS